MAGTCALRHKQLRNLQNTLHRAEGLSRDNSRFCCMPMDGKRRLRLGEASHRKDRVGNVDFTAVPNDRDFHHRAGSPQRC